MNPDQPQPLVVVRRADSNDLDAICAIEQVSFPSPWSRSLLASELAREGAVYLCATSGDELIGYVGMWHCAGEGHVCTLAVAPGWRGRGVGEILMVLVLLEAARLGAELVLLEYRVSNQSAAHLYEKLGFVQVGRRRRYYQDTGEDAVVAVIGGLQVAQTVEELRARAGSWEQERGCELAVDL